MSKKFYLVFFVILVTALLLTGCERPASIAPLTNPTSSEIPFPVATQPQIMKDILSATQTAAAYGTGGLAATSTPAFTFVTPTSAASTSSIIVLSTSTSQVINLATSTVAPTLTPTPIVYPTPTPGHPASYTLHKGEFLYCIARRFNVDPVDLMSANGLTLTTAQYLQPGDKLNIPASGSFPGTRALKTHPVSYTVITGDSLYSIACAFGDADPNTIMAANGMTSDAVTTGQVLYIP